MFAIM